MASGQIVINWEQAYSNDYAAGYVYRQSPVAGRTVREGQSVTLTVSLGIHYVTVPDLTNYVQADGEQQLKDLACRCWSHRPWMSRWPQAPSSAPTPPQAVRWPQAHGGGLRQPPAGGHYHQSPHLIGMNVDDARTLLVQRKLGLGSQTEQYSDQPVGSIISQNPGEGASAKLNTRVSRRGQRRP
mgnify:CR=1 FL=1